MSVGCKIYHKEKVYNSLDWAKEQLQMAPDGSVFLADEHEQTHGRQGREWKDYDGQLKVTLVLKPNRLKDIPPKELPLRLNQLNMALTLGVLEVLKQHGVVLKWPNDFTFDCKKVGGMILEAVWQGNVLVGIIFACAINVNNKILKDDQLYSIATSLRNITDKDADLSVLQGELLKSLDNYYQRWLNFEFDQIYQQWKENQFYLGKQIKVHKKDGTILGGLFQVLLENGDLILIDDYGNKNIIPFFLVEGY